MRQVPQAGLTGHQLHTYNKVDPRGGRDVLVRTGPGSGSASSLILLSGVEYPVGENVE